MIALSTLLAQVEDLNGAGLTLLIVCIGFVLALAGFCFKRLLSQPRPGDHHHAPLDIDTRDHDT